jgi:hypothetical protein
MRTHRTLLALGELYEVVLADHALRDREQLLHLLCDLEECVFDLDDGSPAVDERRRLADAAHAWRRAGELLAGIEGADVLLARVGRYVCDELNRLDRHDATRD